MITTQSVYKNKQEAYGVLYSMLLQRLEDENSNISHKKMPTWQEHIDFVKADIYQDWFIVFDEKTDELVGQFYITNNNEIGIYIINKFRRKGYATHIMNTILKWDKKVNYLANINPKNEASIKFFEKWGFKHIQNIYKRDII